MLMGNPYYYRMPVQYAAFESANQIKLVFIGLNTNNDVASKYEIIINLDGTIIEGNSNVKVTITNIESGDINLSDPYEINLNNLLSAEDSESISTAIGGIDNLNNTVQDNRIIVGTISNGSVSVSIRILGNVTTLYYLLDSVVGLTLNEIAITNTSGTLSKSITTHSVLTENMVINSLESNEATLPLSASQGKVLATDKQNKTDNNLSTTDKTIVGAINEVKQSIDNKDYIIDMASLLSASTSDEINSAIGGWDNLINAIENNKTVKLAVIQDNKIIGVYLPIIIFNSSDSLDLVMSEISYNAVISISYNDGELTQIFDESYVSYIYDYGYLYDYNKLAIRFDTIKNSIKKETVSRITYKDNTQNPLIYGVGYTHSIYDEENNIIKVYSPFYDKEQKKLICNKIVETIITSDGNTSVSIKTLQETTDNNLNTNSKEVIGAINEVNAKSGYYINVSTINNSSTSEEISEAIGGYDNLLNAINNKIHIYAFSTVYQTDSFYPVIRTEVTGNVISIGYIIGTAINFISITNNNEVLSCIAQTVALQTTDDYTLNTSAKTVVGAINELLAKVQELETKNTELESRLAALEGTN